MRFPSGRGLRSECPEPSVMPPASREAGGRVVLALLVAASLAVNAALVARGGLREGADSSRYNDGAQNLLGGRPFQEKQRSYLGYVALVALGQLTGAGAPGVVAVQVVMASLAVAAQFDLGRSYREPLARLLAAVIAGHLLIVALTFADWDGRFLLYALPAVFVLTACATGRAVEAADGTILPPYSYAQGTRTSTAWGNTSTDHPPDPPASTKPPGSPSS